eukprot:2537546-Amphidinium_carterae.1
MARNASRSPSAATRGLTHSPVSVVAQASSRHPRLIADRTCRGSCMLRASIDADASNERIIVIYVYKGKTHGGAAFKIAVPSHVSAGDPLMQDLQSLIQASLGEDFARTCIIPDVESSHRGLLGPATLLQRHMSYSRMTSILNYFL